MIAKIFLFVSVVALVRGGYVHPPVVPSAYAPAPVFRSVLPPPPAVVPAPVFRSFLPPPPAVAPAPVFRSFLPPPPAVAPAPVFRSFLPPPPVVAPAPIVRSVVPPPPVVAPVHHEVDYDPNPQYSYGYTVDDASTGDSKSHIETRSGDFVQGSYSLSDSDGTRRTVDYVADPVNGFNAVVRKEPLALPPPPPVEYAHPVVEKIHY